MLASLSEDWMHYLQGVSHKDIWPCPDAPWASTSTKARAITRNIFPYLFSSQKTRPFSPIAPCYDLLELSKGAIGVLKLPSKWAFAVFDPRDSKDAVHCVPVFAEGSQLATHFYKSFDAAKNHERNRPFSTLIGIVEKP